MARERKAPCVSHLVAEGIRCSRGCPEQVVHHSRAEEGLLCVPPQGDSFALPGALAVLGQVDGLKVTHETWKQVGMCKKAFLKKNPLGLSQYSSQLLCLAGTVLM